MAPLPIILCIAVGIIVGCIYVFQEYRGKPSDEISKNPRLKNLSVVIGPGVLGAVIDWKAIAGGQDVAVTKQGILIYYSVAVAVTITVLLALGMTVVALEARKRNLHVTSRARIPPLAAIGLFISRGLSAYEERVIRADREAARDAPANPIRVYAGAMRVALLAEEGFRSSQQSREVAVADILRVIVDAARAQLPDARSAVIGAHWLKAIPANQFTAAEQAEYKFGTLPLDGCPDVLVLEQYGRDQKGGKYALPVNRDQLRCLTGAPLAFRKEAVVATLTSKIRFGSIVPKAFQSEMKKFFNDNLRRSQLCVPLQSGTRIVGIVVLEANSDLFDPSDSKVVEVGESLYPLCLTLATLLNGSST